MKFLKRHRLTLVLGGLYLIVMVISLFYEPTSSGVDLLNNWGSGFNAFFLGADGEEFIEKLPFDQLCFGIQELYDCMTYGAVITLALMSYSSWAADAFMEKYKYKPEKTGKRKKLGPAIENFLVSVFSANIIAFLSAVVGRLLWDGLNTLAANGDSLKELMPEAAFTALRVLIVAVCGLLFLIPILVNSGFFVVYMVGSFAVDGIFRYINTDKDTLLILYTVAVLIYNLLMSFILDKLQTPAIFPNKMLFRLIKKIFGKKRRGKTNGADGTDGTSKN